MRFLMIGGGVAQEKRNFGKSLRRFAGEQIDHVVLVLQLRGIGIRLQMRCHRPGIFIADSPDRVFELAQVFFPAIRQLSTAKAARRPRRGK